MPCVSSKIGGEEIGRLDACGGPARLACSSASLNSSLVDGATRRSRPAHAGSSRQVLFERLEDLVRVQLEVAHDLAEHVPLDLGEGQADVLVGEQRVLAAAGLVEGAVDDALGRLSQLVLRDVEVFSSRPSPGRAVAEQDRAQAQSPTAHEACCMANGRVGWETSMPDSRR